MQWKMVMYVADDGKFGTPLAHPRPPLLFVN